MKTLDGFTFISGLGREAARRACIMSAVSYVAGEPWSDHPECACPVITAFAIRVNDASWWESDAERTETLRPLVERIVGTRNPDLAEARRWIAADFAVRSMAPLALESAAKRPRNPKHAAECERHAGILRALPEVTRETRDEAVRKCREARDATAASSASAAASAAAAADAYAYAYAAADAAAAYARLAAKRPYRDAAVACLVRMIEVRP